MQSLSRGSEFARFVLVGGAGFCIDGGLLSLLMHSGWEIFPARSVSFILAVTSTWALNRFWTFEVARRMGMRREYTSYIVTQVLGAVINLAIFFILIKLYPLLRSTPLIPLAFGASIALVFNYTVSKKYVFEKATK